MSSTSSWDDYRLVGAIAETGSLVGAAERLGINHSTVFRRLGALEKALGARLFERSRTGYATTPAGEEMVAVAHRIAENITEFERGVAGRDVKPAGLLRVTTNDTFITYLLAPVLASFRKAYPKIALDVIVTQQSLNLSRRDADIAIRATMDPPETLIGRKIATFRWSCYAPKDWLKEGEKFDIRTADWVGYGANLSVLPARTWLERQVPAHRIGARFDSLVGVAQGISAGLGIGAIPCFIGAHIDNIVPVGELLEFGDALWLLTHADLRNTARVRVFLDHAASELAKQRKLIEGK
ncbi:MAG: LysR family transcriptional regulator [Beijerinckiaceae bacterium]